VEVIVSEKEIIAVCVVGCEGWRDAITTCLMQNVAMVPRTGFNLRLSRSTGGGGDHDRDWHWWGAKVESELIASMDVATLIGFVRGVRETNSNVRMVLNNIVWLCSIQMQ